MRRDGQEHRSLHVAAGQTPRGLTGFTSELRRHLFDGHSQYASLYPCGLQQHVTVIEASVLRASARQAKRFPLPTEKEKSTTMRSSLTVSDQIYRGGRRVKLNAASIVLTIATPFGSSIAQSQRFQRAAVSARWRRIAQVSQSNAKDMRQDRSGPSERRLGQTSVPTNWPARRDERRPSVSMSAVN